LENYGSILFELPSSGQSLSLMNTWVTQDSGTLSFGISFQKWGEKDFSAEERLLPQLRDLWSSFVKSDRQNLTWKQ
jgi:hypothetical protein